MADQTRTHGLRPFITVAFGIAAAVGMSSVGRLAAQSTGKTPMRVAAAQPRNRTIDFHSTPSQVLTKVDQSLAELEQLVHKAGAAGCDALALPEDTLGLLRWE